VWTVLWLLVLQNYIKLWNCYATLNQEGGNIRPAKASFLALKKHMFDLNLARKTQLKAKCGPRTKIVAHPCSKLWKNTIEQNCRTKRNNSGKFEPCLWFSRLSTKFFLIMGSYCRFACGKSHWDRIREHRTSKTGISKNKVGN